MGRAYALHADDPGSIFVISYVPLSPTGVIPDCRAKSNPWAQPDVDPQNWHTHIIIHWYYFTILSYGVSLSVHHRQTYYENVIHIQNGYYAAAWDDEMQFVATYLELKDTMVSEESQKKKDKQDDFNLSVVYRITTWGSVM